MASYDVWAGAVTAPELHTRWLSAREAVELAERLEADGHVVLAFDAATGKRVGLIALVRIASGEVAP